jgi:CheY-like chemotaxis protein
MKPTILLVEDEETDAYFVGWAIQKLGCDWRLHHVEDGQRAVEYLEHTHGFEDSQLYATPDLVLLDLNMPRMSGFEFLEWIRERPQWRGLRVVILSSSDHPADRERARGLGAAEYRIKPHNPTGLLEFIREVRERWLPDTSEGSSPSGSAPV